MDKTNTSRFIESFSPSNKDHVMWLKKMTDFADNISDPSKAMNLVNEVNDNPMGIKLEHKDALDWFHIHFVLAGSYSRAVLKGQAWVPDVHTSQ
jgi:hypothetical protein